MRAFSILRRKGPDRCTKARRPTPLAQDGDRHLTRVDGAGLRRGWNDGRTMSSMPPHNTQPFKAAERRARAAASVANDALADAANAIPRGLLVFDCDARVLAHNAAAARMLSRGAPLALAPISGRPIGVMRLAGSDAALQAAVKQAVHECAMPSGPPDSGLESVSAARSLRIDTAAIGRSSVLHLAPVRRPIRSGSPGTAGSAVIGTLIHFGPREPLGVALLAELFDLSTSSARVAEAYLRVDSVKEAARQLGISTNTVKTHLAKVYERTGCSRQSQLVRLVMSLRAGAAG
jgi:DNA-binding NarL/FixJ family response regulator